MEKLLIIDCHAVCHSVRHAFGGLTWEDRHTGVIYGFLDRLLSLSSKLEIKKIVFAWDSTKSYRKDIFPEYKMKRHDEDDKTEEEKEIDDAAFPQFSRLRMSTLPALGFNNNFIQTGYEADDIIASLCFHYYKTYDIIFASDDQDLYQLLDCSDMWKLKKKVLYTKQDFFDEYNICSIEWVWVKTLGGCDGDGVPGIPGIGINRSIAYITGKLTRGKYFEAIKFAPKELINRNKALVELPFKGTKHFDIKPDTLNLPAITDLCEQHGMYSLIKGRRLESWKKLLQE